MRFPRNATLQVFSVQNIQTIALKLIDFVMQIYSDSIHPLAVPGHWFCGVGLHDLYSN